MLFYVCIIPGTDIIRKSKEKYMKEHTEAKTSLEKRKINRNKTKIFSFLDVSVSK